ncbi:MAG: hypothetical protein HZB18_11115 [Chloroflexi bacterium]|nr:hypothetical protein [Chloroflexota bacterium]
MRGGKRGDTIIEPIEITEKIGMHPMPTAKRKSKSKPKRKAPPANEIEFSIKPGTKITLTIEAGRERAGEVPVRIRVEGVKTGGGNSGAARGRSRLGKM